MQESEAPAKRAILSSRQYMGATTLPIWKKSGVLLQIAALLLLQLYIFLPSLAKAVTPHGTTAHCFHDHRLCGCSPERIANHTCCCCSHHEPAEPPCCAKKHHDEKPAARPVDAPSQRRISAAPCGSHPQFITASLDKIKFVRCASSAVMPDVLPSTYPLQSRGIFQRRSSEPPEPPPKILLSCYIIS